MSGFYKHEDGADDLLHGPNFVLNMEYELRAESHDQYEYPIDGWYWFDSAEEAYAFFNIQMPEHTIETPWMIGDHYGN